MISRRAFLVGSPALALMPIQADAWPARRRIVDISLETGAGRKVNVRLFAPSGGARRYGFIVFSHGANSSGRLYDALLAPLAAAGFVVAAPTHVDSEANPDRAKFDQAAIFQTRLDDLKLVSNAASQLSAQAGVSAARFDPDALVVAGHSYGAWQALMLAGAGCGAFGIGGGQLADPRFKAALAISPPGAIPGMISTDDYASIGAPILITTGRRDILPGFVERWEDRLLAYERATGPAAALIMPDVDHYFGGAICRANVPGPRQSRSLAKTATVAASFARAYGASDTDALMRLNAIQRSVADLRMRNQR
jgi:pimeloyl-ACP methyl ester carboxylesterase